MSQPYNRSFRIRFVLLALATCFVLSSLGCSFDVPEDGVQLVVEQELSEDQMTILKVRLESLRDEGGSQSISTMTLNGATTINLSPVADVSNFTERIDFADVSSVEGRVVHLSVNVARL